MWDDSGASLVEWGILVSLIAVVALIAVAVLGSSTSDLMSEIGNGFP